MNAATLSEEWKTIISAVTALLQDRLLLQAKAFLEAVRGLKGAALVLLFELAHTFVETVGGSAAKTRSTPAPPPASAEGRGAPRPDVWRNPPVTAYVADPPPGGRRLSPCPAERTRPSEEAAVGKALATLKAILTLCANPEPFARRLARAIAATDHVLIAAYVRAVGDRARAIDRRNHRAWRFLKGERRRRRRDTG